MRKMSLLCVAYPKGAIYQWPYYSWFSHVHSEPPLRALIKILNSIDFFVKEDILNWASGLSEFHELEG